MAAQLLVDEPADRGSREQGRTLGHHIVVQIPVSAFVVSRSGFDSDSPALSTTNQRPPTHDLPWLAARRGMPPEEPIHR